MLDDNYSLLDYIKFICNAKVRYEPKKKSYIQPFLFYCLTFVLMFLNFGAITINNIVVFWVQTVIFAISVVLFTSLILPQKRLEKTHDYTYYAEQ